MEEIAYAPLIDREPPEGLVRWALRMGKLNREYLIYKAGRAYEPLEERYRPAVEVRCSACGETFTAEKVENGCCHNSLSPAPFGFVDPGTGFPVISGQNALCPCCGAEAELVHVGQIRGGLWQHIWCAVPGRVPIPDRTDRFALTDWRVTRHINKEGNSTYSTRRWTAWVVEDRKVVRLVGYQKFFNNVTLHPLSQRKLFRDDFGQAELIWPTGQEDLNGTTAENSKLDRYIAQGGKRLVAYLALWRKKPTVENLVMQEYGGLVDGLIGAEDDKGIPRLPEIDWKDKRPHRMLHMSKEEFRGPGRELTAQDWKILRWARTAGITVTLPEGLEPLKRLGGYGCQALLDLVGPDDFSRAARYLQKQNSTVMVLRDYRRDVATAGWDLADPDVLWPRRLPAAHDRAATAARMRVERENAQLFQARYEALRPYAAENDGILIRPCRTQEELTAEGQALHHCVAGYARDVATGKTAIFFVRRQAEPDKPWYTLELDEKKLEVRQNRGDHNCARTPEVERFERQWLAWIRAGAKRDADGLPQWGGAQKERSIA